MDITLSTWMFIFFIVGFIISVFKIYAFLPNKQLEDDDRTEDAEKELIQLMLLVIKESTGDINENELFTLIKQHKSFNNKLFWRFNLNRLHHLLHSYYIRHKECKSIEDIYRKINS